MEASVKPMYRVSEDFNARLLDRISDERYAEVRSQAHLPRKTPLFGWARIAPAVVTVTALALVAVGLLSDKTLETPQLVKNFSKALASTPALELDDFGAPPLGERLGLKEKYMTAQPINNPTFDGASPARASISSSPASGADLVSSLSGPPSRWQFTRQLERARRIMEISNSLGMGHAYFEVIKYQTPQRSGVMIVRVNPYGAMSRHSQPQIIIRPNPLRENDGRTPAGRLVGSF